MRRTGGRDRWIDSYLAVAAATARKFLMVLDDWNGEPNSRELEPDDRFCQADRRTSSSRVEPDASVRLRG